MTHSFEAFIPEARPQLLGYARSLTRNRSAAEDLVQETFTRAVTGWDDGNFRQFMRWARTTLKRAHLDWIERVNIRKDGLPTLRASHATEIPGRFTESAVERRDFHRAWGALIDDHRKVVSAIAIDGLSYKEAAVALQWPIGTVMSRLSRARTALRQFLEEGVPASKMMPVQRSGLRLVQNEVGLRHPAGTTSQEADIPPRLTLHLLRAA